MSTLPLFVRYIITAIIGAVPIIELRGAIPVGVFTFHLNYVESFVCSFIGNILPVYFIVKYISERLQNFVALGLFLGVAIPLPGTGAWIGSLVANFLDVPPKKAIPPIIAGVLVAGFIILALTAAANGGIQYLLQNN